MWYLVWIKLSVKSSPSKTLDKNAYIVHNIDRNFLLQKQCDLPIEHIYGTSAHNSHLSNALRWQPKSWKYHPKEGERSFLISHLKPMLTPSPREFKLTQNWQSIYNQVNVTQLRLVSPPLLLLLYFCPLPHVLPIFMPSLCLPCPCNPVHCV